MDNWKTFKPLMQLLTLTNLKNAFFTPGMFNFLIGLEFLKNSMFKGIKNELGGRENFAFPGGFSKTGKWEELELEKMQICLGSRLHACSAWEVNVAKDFVFSNGSNENFLARTKQCKPDEKLSLFKLKVYFNFPHERDPSVPAQTTLYSYDFAHERQQTRTGVFNKAFQTYNGYIYQLRYCHRLFLRNDLYYARVFNHQSIDREELDYLHPENILVRMHELGLE